MSLRLRAEGAALYDADDRRVLLRGVNAGGRSKLPPFLPFDPEPDFETAQARYVARVVEWGHDVVRLPFTWEAVEPERRAYDDAFLERYAGLAAAFGAAGIRVIVDFHQDVFARPFAGDGFPSWAVPEGDWPAVDPHQWFLGYVVHDGVKRAFDRFWRNEDGLRDAFTAMWRRVAKRLWRIDAVIGFEIINEPGWGSARPDVWAEQVLAPFYTDMAAIVRGVAPGALVFFDATGGDALVGETALPRPDGNGLVFAPHAYAQEVILSGTWKGRGDFRATLGKWAALGRRWQVPVLLGEFGCPHRVEAAPEYIRRHFDALDAHGLHGTLWEYSESTVDWNDEGMSVCGPEGERVTAAAAVRVYPRALAGEPLAFSYDADTRVAELRFEAGEGESEVALPERLYPGGYSIDVHGAEATREPGTLRLRHAAGPVEARVAPKVS